MGVLRHYGMIGLMASLVMAQFPFSTVPTISEELKKTTRDDEAGSFLRLWRYALVTDGQGPRPVTRINIEAKTILAPGRLALINLVPQDASDPLYGDTPAHADLRRDYLLDHMVLEPVEPTDPNLTKSGGLRLLTLSGKEVTFKKDKKGQMFVNDVPVTRVTSLKDGTQLYILQSILFDNRQKVHVSFYRNNLQDELNGPTGPPLDLAPAPPVSVRAPAPPPRGVVGPPANPDRPLIFPPAPPPPSFRFSGPPAPPPSSSRFSGPPAPPPSSSRFSGPPAPPPSSSRFSGPPAPPPPQASRFFSPPAPPPSDSFDAVVVPHRQGQVRVNV